MKPQVESWMLDNLMQIKDVTSCVVLSADGLLMGRNETLERDEADRFAASMSAMQSLSRIANSEVQDVNSHWLQTLVEGTTGYIFLASAGEGAYVAVATGKTVDMEAIAFAIQQLVQRLGKYLSSPPREDAGRQ
ncbi:roadblock/LC7 domain-containing protein [Streptomyces sp. 8L]|uniref:roadblock/LC7 domain-containing protein n=1 Tax=Streptomyces sp. 8L TaxID=2877242 RepID=UPI001CD2B7A2|nr:roadblock/LC7 domain-containing protein [Streptomyces sp. 8L]MCA1217155.1 roadblock/LC7 domain-containing protein [Streptomyces sp. 8L]